MAVFCKTHRNSQRHVADGCVWFVDYYVNGRRKREAAGPSRRVAERVLGKRRGEIREGKFFEKRPEERVVWDEIAEDFLRYSAARKRSHAGDVYTVEVLRKRFGGKLLKEITPGMIEEYVGDRLSGRIGRHPAKPATVNRHLAALKTTFSLAIKNRKATYNPVREVRLLKENNERRRFLSVEEAGRLLASSPDSLRPLVVMALYTGMRRGEMLGLCWREVDLGRGMLRIQQSKSGEGRDVPIADPLRGMLRERYLRAEPAEDDLVFGTKPGPHKGVWRLERVFAAAVRRAGLADFRFHDLRHTAASHLVMSGVDIATVRDILGHKTLAMTLRYSHLSPQHKAGAVKQLTGAFRSLEASEWTPGWTPRPEAGSTASDENDVISSGKPGWRNWQTRATQNRVAFEAVGVQPSPWAQ